MTSFRQFIRLTEEDTAPPTGMPKSPDNPENKTNKHHFDSLQRHLGIGDDEMTSALEGDALTIWKIPDYSSKWGFNVSGPVQAELTKRPDGSFDVKYMLQQKKLMEPKAFTRPYKDGNRPFYYEGPIEDRVERMNAEEIQDAITAPYASMAADPMGGMAGGIGGMPPMGGM